MTASVFMALLLDQYAAACVRWARDNATLKRKDAEHKGDPIWRQTAERRSLAGDCRASGRVRDRLLAAILCYAPIGTGDA